MIQEDCAQAFDMNWLDSIPLCATFEDAIKIARQDTTDDSTIEILFQGQFEIGDVVDTDQLISLYKSEGVPYKVCSKNIGNNLFGVRVKTRSKYLNYVSSMNLLE